MADNNDKAKPDAGERVFVPQKPPVAPQANPAQPQVQPGATPTPAAQPSKEGSGSSNEASLTGQPAVVGRGIAVGSGEVLHFVGKESMVPQGPPVATSCRTSTDGDTPSLLSGQAMVAQKAPVINASVANPNNKATQQPEAKPRKAPESKPDLPPSKT